MGKLKHEEFKEIATALIMIMVVNLGFSMKNSIAEFIVQPPKMGVVKNVKISGNLRKKKREQGRGNSIWAKKIVSYLKTKWRKPECRTLVAEIEIRS